VTSLPFFRGGVIKYCDFIVFRVKGLSYHEHSSEGRTLGFRCLGLYRDFIAFRGGVIKYCDFIVFCVKGLSYHEHSSEELERYSNFANFVIVSCPFFAGPRPGGRIGGCVNGMVYPESFSQDMPSAGS